MDIATESKMPGVEASATTPEQDSIRIPHLLARLERYWMHNPELRLGQILGNIASESGKETYFVDDSLVSQRLEELAPSW